ncbi:hypothetical protein HEQ60_07545 [Haematospirillum sp. H1815]|uniref:hypothetical protein n=1 Tax=Haematospirillum sp. H1815 TaxID=2723108 RepID=UPI00143AF67C|nr:hypothetical protein [Haematospirillum sp. H1815]NKD77610.1 hypothetical protein [Haematospirillum sp. H1815]
MTAPPRPPIPGIPDSAVLRQELRRIGDILFQARSSISDGTLPRLGDLERMIRTACTSIHLMTKDDARGLRPMMEALFYDLDALETEMRNRFGDLALRPGIQPGNEPTQAVTVGAAYRHAQKLHIPPLGEEHRQSDTVTHRQSDPATHPARSV